MRHLTGLLSEELKQEIYGLWEVVSIPAGCGSLMITSWSDIFLTCRSTRPRAVLKPDWWKSLTSWRWFCRLMSMRSWRELREDCRSSLTPLMVSLCSVGLDPFCSLALTGFVGFQVVSTTLTCSSSSDLWMNRGGVTWQWQRVQRFPRTLNWPPEVPSHLHVKHVSPPPQCRGRKKYPGLFWAHVEATVRCRIRCEVV